MFAEMIKGALSRKCVPRRSGNSILTDNEQNRVFKKFIDFVDRMLLFYSLDNRGYEGFMNGAEGIAEGICNAGKVKDFQQLSTM